MRMSLGVDSDVDSGHAVESPDNTSTETSTEQGALPASKTKRVLQSIGAVIVTGLVFYFIFGIPAYLLFGMFFD